MPLNKPSGNMYPNCYTWNPLGGRCPHNCDYCYVDRLRDRFEMEKYMGDFKLVRKEFKVDLTVPEGYVVFVCSCIDLFADEVPGVWIEHILYHLTEFPETDFLLQTKNPGRFLEFNIPENCILGTTVESNRDYEVSEAPSPEVRFLAMLRLDEDRRIMVSMEPVLDFDVDTILVWMLNLMPEYVSVGADSGDNGVPEPRREKLELFLNQLKYVTEVKEKKNLKRLLDEKSYQKGTSGEER